MSNKQDKNIKISVWKTSQHMKSDTFEINLYRDKKFQAVPFHSHGFFELYVFLQGAGVYTVEQGDYNLEPGDIILIPPNHLHRLDILDSNISYERIVLWINPNYLSLFSTPQTRLDEVFYNCGKNNNYLIRDVKFSKILQKKLTALHHSDHSNKYGSDIETRIHFESLLLLLSRHLIEGEYSTKPPTINKVVNQTIQYINDNIGNKLSLEELSEHNHISKYYLARLFKDHTGTSPHQFIIKKRLSLSKTLLAQGYSIKQACLMVGFSDYTHYFRAFKKEFDITPKQYLDFIQGK